MDVTETVCVLDALVVADVVNDELAVVFAVALTDVEAVELTDDYKVDDTVTETVLLSVLEHV